MVEAGQIRDVVAAFVIHRDADRFLSEFSPLSYNIHKNGTQEAMDLANAVESRLASLRGGCISMDGFVDALKSLQG